MVAGVPKGNVIISRRLPSGKVEVTKEGKARRAAAERKFGGGGSSGGREIITGQNVQGRPTIQTTTKTGTRFFLTDTGRITFRVGGSQPPKGSVEVSESFFKGVKTGVNSGKVARSDIKLFTQNTLNKGITEVGFNETKEAFAGTKDITPAEQVAAEKATALDFISGAKQIDSPTFIGSDKFRDLAKRQQVESALSISRNVSTTVSLDNFKLSAENKQFEVNLKPLSTSLKNQLALSKSALSNVEKIQKAQFSSGALGTFFGGLKKPSKIVDIFSIDNKVSKKQEDIFTNQFLLKKAKSLQRGDLSPIQKRTAFEKFQTGKLNDLVEFEGLSGFSKGVRKISQKKITFTDKSLKDLFISSGEKAFRKGKDISLPKTKSSLFLLSPSKSIINLPSTVLKTLGGGLISTGKRPERAVIAGGLGVVTGGLGGFIAGSSAAGATAVGITGKAFTAVFLGGTAAETGFAAVTKGEKAAFETLGGRLFEFGAFAGGAKAGSIVGPKILSALDPKTGDIKIKQIKIRNGETIIKTSGRKGFIGFETTQIQTPKLTTTTVKTGGRTIKILRPVRGTATATVKLGKSIRSIKVPKIKSQDFNTKFLLESALGKSKKKGKVKFDLATQFKGNFLQGERGISRIKGIVNVEAQTALQKFNNNFLTGPKGRTVPLDVTLDATGFIKGPRVRPGVKALGVGIVAGLISPGSAVAAGAIVGGTRGGRFTGTDDFTNRFLTGKFTGGKTQFKAVVPKVSRANIPRIKITPDLFLPKNAKVKFSIPTVAPIVSGVSFAPFLFNIKPSFKPSLPSLSRYNNLFVSPIKSKPISFTKISGSSQFKGITQPGFDSGFINDFISGPSSGPGAGPITVPGTDFTPDITPRPRAGSDFVPDIFIPDVPPPIIPGGFPFLPKGFPGFTGKRRKRRKKGKRKFKFTSTFFAPKFSKLLGIVNPKHFKATGFEFRL